MISPLERTRLAACAVPAAARPTLKCTFSQHGGALKLGGGGGGAFAYLGFDLQQPPRLADGRADRHGPRPQVRRSRQKDPSLKTGWSGSVKSPQSLEKELFVGALSPWDPVPSAGGVPSRLDPEVGSYAYLGNSPCAFQPPTIVPTSPPSIPSTPCKEHGSLIEETLHLLSPMHRANSEWDPVFTFRPQPASRDSRPPCGQSTLLRSTGSSQNMRGCSDRPSRALCR